MGLLRSLITLPVKGPVDGALWVARKINQQAQEEFNDPAQIRRTLAVLEGQMLAGEISEEAYDEAETALLMRMKAAS